MWPLASRVTESRSSDISFTRRTVEGLGRPIAAHPPERHGMSAAGQFAAHADERVDVARAAQGDEHCMQRSLVDHPLLPPHADSPATLPAAVRQAATAP